jgi:lysophospholipase L1-like esterase
MRSTTLALVLASSLLAAGPATAQTPLKLVAVGDSLAAGFSDGSLVVHHQRNSVPAHLARQMGIADFQQPEIADPGLPPELVLVNLTPVIARKSTTPGAPTNAALNRPYDNLAVPGATSGDVLTRTTDNGGLTDLILRGRGTQVAQAVSLRPTHVLLWVGNNDVLGAALAGRAIPGTTLTPPSVFRQNYAQIVSALVATGARVVTANLPDVTSIPFVTTIRPVVPDPATGRPLVVGGQTIPLLGPSGPLASNALVTLNAAPLLQQGVGIPTTLGGTGAGLPDEVVLDANEVAIIQDHVNANNRAIAEIALANRLPVVDMNALLAEAAGGGREIGGVTLTSTFLTGGLFGYDGVHPTDLGNAVVANEWIAALKAGFDEQVTPVDLRPFFGFSGAPRAFGLEADALHWQDTLEPR